MSEKYNMGNEKYPVDDIEARPQHFDPKGRSPDHKYEIDVVPAGAPVHDAVFGDLDDSGPNYRAVGLLGSFILMTKANLGLGVLALPSVFGVLGLVPGIILILVIQSIVAYCATVIGAFKINHPEVYGLADAGYVFGGRIGKELLYGTFCIFMLFIIGSACVGVSTALNAVSSHGACTAIFVAVAAICGFFLGSVRTLGKISWIGWLGIFSILAATITLTVATGVQDRPSEAPPTGPWEKDIQIAPNPSFAAAMSMVNVIVFSYGGTPMYFGVVSEMRDPRRFTISMVSSVFFLTVVYLIIGCTVYHFCGQYVASPALGSAGLLMKKVCYGLAIPGLLASLCIFTHLSAKNIFVRVLAGSKHLTNNSKIHWITWLSCTFGSVLLGYIIASGIPIFGPLISLIGALICPNVCITPYTFMWWHDNWRFNRNKTSRTYMFGALNLCLLLVGIFLTGAGTYGAIVDIIASPAGSGPWTCANNAGRVA